MTKRAIIVAGVIIALTGLGFLVARPPSSISGRILTFTLAQLMLTNVNEGSNSWSVMISNASTSAVMFPGGGNKAWLHVAYLTSNGPRSAQVRTPGGGDGVILPGGQLTNFLEIPEGVTQLRVGLPVTSLTWRGRLAWQLAGSHLSSALRPLIGFLLGRDEKVRSITEWSEVYLPAESSP